APPGPPPAGQAPAGAPPASPRDSAAVGGNVASIFARIRAGQAPAQETPAVDLAPAAPQAKGAPDGALSDADEALLQRRDSATMETEIGLSRRLKRVLQDEQNDLLDRLRGVRGEPVAADLLPRPATQTARLVAASRPLLDQAIRAGAGFTQEMAGGSPAQTAPGADGEDLSVALAEAVAMPLRQRLIHAFESAAGDEQSVLVDALGAAYREWKTHRIERLAADHVAGAFALGSFEAVPPGAGVRWLVNDVDGPCPDCDDNALAGVVARAEEFPTGQRHPPAHSGCRCLLVLGG
ncbi:MAG: hypothetical protein ACRDY0_12155, partial [Acidimicrobiales bacterium]